MKQEPWRNWVPGVLSKKQVMELCDEDLIRQVEDFENSIDESSIDLTLTDEVYKLCEGSVKPFGEKTYLHTLEKLSLVEKIEPDGEAYILKKSNTYLVKVREKLANRLNGKEIFGQATAKSSIGRVDVLVRTIVDGMTGYDIYDPNREGEGDIFAEITPISFDVRIKSGISLAQLRLFYGDPRNAEVRGREICKTCMPKSQNSGGFLTLDLDPVEIGSLEGAAFEGEETTNPDALNLWKQDEDEKPKPWDYFKFLEATDKRIALNPSSFYILRSKERLSIPDSIAVYIRAIDETLGEMRIHYAGFAHPWFGRNRPDQRGTPIIFEVRGHDFPAVLLDNEKMAQLTFYRMSDAAEKPEVSDYDSQELKLSNLFAQFPEKLSRKKDGTIAPVGKK